MEEKREVLANKLNEIQAENQKQMLDRIRAKYSKAKLNMLQAAEVAAATAAVG